MPNPHRGRDDALRAVADLPLGVAARLQVHVQSGAGAAAVEDGERPDQVPSGWGAGRHQRAAHHAGPADVEPTSHLAVVTASQADLHRTVAEPAAGVLGDHLQLHLGPHPWPRDRPVARPGHAGRPGITGPSDDLDRLDRHVWASPAGVVDRRRPARRRAAAVAHEASRGVDQRRAPDPPRPAPRAQLMTASIPQPSPRPRPRHRAIQVDAATAWRAWACRSAPCPSRCRRRRPSTSARSARGPSAPSRRGCRRCRSSRACPR